MFYFLIAWGILCFIFSALLFIFAWRTIKKQGEITSCENCLSAIEDMRYSSITGCWFCPTCGNSFTFVDGQLDRIDIT